MFGGFCRGLFSYGFNGNFPMFMGIMMVGFWIAVFSVIYFLYKKINYHDNEALDILNIKFANGEISEEEYLKKKELLIKNRTR